MNEIGFDAAAESMQYASNNAANIAHPHIMPTPTNAPWNLDSMPWKLASTGNQAMTSGVMQFSGDKLAEEIGAHRTMQLHQKRKSDSLITTLPTKQFISEEKIAAHFNGLHISSDYVHNTNSSSSSSTSLQSYDDKPTTSGRCFANQSFHDYQVTSKELEEKLRNANRITVCDEIKRFQDEQKKSSLIPEALLSRVERPCSALVLWQPPPVLNLLNQQMDERKTTAESNADKSEDCIDDDSLTDISHDVELNDFVNNNNNTTPLDFNNLSADSMDEDL